MSAEAARAAAGAAADHALEELLHTVWHKLPPLFQAERVWLWLVDADKEELFTAVPLAHAGGMHAAGMGR